MKLLVFYFSGFYVCIVYICIFVKVLKLMCKPVQSCLINKKISQKNKTWTVFSCKSNLCFMHAKSANNTIRDEQVSRL